MIARAIVCALAATSTATAWAGPDIELPPEAYLDPIDQQIARTGKPVGDRHTPCEILLKSETRDGKTYRDVTRVPTEKCVKTTARQRWTGLWRADFEGSQFCPAPATTCGYAFKAERMEPSIWLGFAHDVPIELPQVRTGALYAVEFEGRRTVFPGRYGHMGVFDAEVIVDRVISLKEVEPPPKPSKADLKVMKRDCLATPSCAQDKDMMKALDDALNE